MSRPLKPVQRRGIRFYGDGRVTLPYRWGTTHTTTASPREAMRQIEHVIQSIGTGNRADVRGAIRVWQINRKIIALGKANKPLLGRERLTEQERQGLKKDLMQLVFDFTGLSRHMGRRFTGATPMPAWLQAASPMARELLGKPEASHADLKAFFGQIKGRLLRDADRAEFASRIVAAFKFLDNGNLPPANTLLITAAKRTAPRRTAGTLVARERWQGHLAIVRAHYERWSALNGEMTDALVEVRQKMEGGKYKLGDLPALAADFRERAERLKFLPYPEHQGARKMLLAMAGMMDRARGTAQPGVSMSPEVVANRQQLKASVVGQLKRAIGLFPKNQRKLDFNKPD